MTYNTIHLSLLIAAIIGCSKRTPVPPTGDQPVTGIVEATDPNATYAIKSHRPAKGEKSTVAKSRSGSMTTTTANSTQTLEEKSRFEYLETVSDADPEEVRPNKVSRTYSIAEKTNQQGEMQQLSYAGKTVTIEKYLKGYRFAADGKSLPVAEQIELNNDFTSGQGNIEAMLPKTPVKVGEQWTVDLSAIKALAGNLPFAYHKDKSSITGKLLRAYTKDGRQWGVIEWKIVVVFDTVATNGSPIRGSLPSTVTMDAVIDGSARAGKTTITMQGKVDHRDMIGHEVKTTIEGTQEQSFAPVK